MGQLRETQTQRLQRIAETPMSRLLPSEAAEMKTWLESASQEEQAAVWPSKPIAGAMERPSAPAPDPEET